MPRIVMGGTNLNYEWKEGNHYLDLMGDGGAGILAEIFIMQYIFTVTISINNGQPHTILHA